MVIQNGPVVPLRRIVFIIAGRIYWDPSDPEQPADRGIDTCHPAPPLWSTNRWSCRDHWMGDTDRNDRQWKPTGPNQEQHVHLRMHASGRDLRICPRPK